MCVIAVALGLVVLAAAPAPTGPEPAPVSGSFAGVLDRPIDAAQLTRMPFGTRSHWLQPWRAYLDTPPAQQLRDAVGINFNVNAGQAAAAARLLAANGFHRARIEISWGEVDYDNPDRLYRAGEWRTRLEALRAAGLRPLLLLNSNHGRPAPAKALPLTVAVPAAAGARTVQLSAASASAVVPGRTGFDVADRAAGVLITYVSPSGTATLSRPIPIALGAGTYPGTVLRYEPFSRLEDFDGSPSRRGLETMAGWLEYVRTVTSFVKDVLGSTEFDVEVTNETTFGAAFYDINEYYSPALTQQGLDLHVLLERTVRWIKDPAHGLAGVRVGSGVSNQTPWNTPATAPHGLDALDKHPYPRYMRFPRAKLPNRPVDGDGERTSFTPTYVTFFPEYYLTGIQTETLVRDIAPMVSMVPDPLGRVLPHGRDVPAPDGTSKQVWLTEIGLETDWAAANLGQNLSRADVEHIRAKSALRTLVSFVNKGVTQVDLFAAGTREWGLIGDEFWSALRTKRAYPGDGAGGPAIRAIGRLVRALGTSAVQTRRSLSLASIGDCAGGIQWAGDGLDHPPLRNRDVLAFLPFQASDHRFVVPIYVMTRNMATAYRDAAGPQRYDLPAERFRMTIGGTDAAQAKVSATDPVTGESVPVTVVDRTATGWLVVEMPVTDSPRLLVIDDRRP
jgi:hypothetical protein